MPAVITGLAYRLGRLTPLEEMAGDVLSADAVEALLGRGQRVCSVADSEYPLIVASVGETLARAQVPPDQIDRVLVTSESILISGSKRGHERRRAELYGHLVDCGLSSAPVMMITFAGCSSAVVALEYASHLVRDGGAEHVLVIAVDRVLEDADRILEPGVSVVGDGAASCIVTNRVGDRGELELRWVRRRGFLKAVTYQRSGNFGPALIMLGRALTSLSREVGAESLSLAGSWLACNNYGLPTVRLFAHALGCPDDYVFTHNVAAIGHLGSPDPLVNLAALAEKDTGVVLLATGPADCTLAFLSPVGRAERP